MIEPVDPDGTPPDEGGKSPSAYAMTDPHYLPRMRRLRPVRIGFKVCDSDTDIHSMTVDLLDQQVVFLRPKLKMSWRWPFFNIEWESIREIICSRKSRVDNQGKPVNCTGSAWLISLKNVDPQLVMGSAVNAFSPTHSQVKEESSPAGHRTAETGGSGGHTVRWWFRPELVTVLALLLVGIVGCIWMIAGEPAAESRARHVSIADLMLPSEPSLTDGGEIETSDTGDPFGPVLKADAPATVVDDVTAVSTTYSSDCEPYDPEGMSWYRYSKRLETEGQQIVICGEDGMFTTSGFHRDDDGNQVWDDLLVYAP